MKATQLLLLVCAVLLASACAGRQTTGLAYRSEPLDIPRSLIAYSFACTRRPSFAPIFDADDGNPVGSAFSRLDRGMERLSIDLSSRLADVRDARLVPVDSSYAVSGEEPKSAFLVIPQEDGSALVIVSSIAPYRTSILAVDGEFGVRLIYDSDALNQDGTQSVTRVGAVTGISVYESARFSVEDIPSEGEHRRVQDFSIEGAAFYFGSPRI